MPRRGGSNPKLAAFRLDGFSCRRRSGPDTDYRQKALEVRRQLRRALPDAWVNVDGFGSEMPEDPESEPSATHADRESADDEQAAAAARSFYRESPVARQSRATGARQPGNAAA